MAKLYTDDVFLGMYINGETENLHVWKEGSAPESREPQGKLYYLEVDDNVLKIDPVEFSFIEGTPVVLSRDQRQMQVTLFHEVVNN
jgi:hypothetical protein